MFSYKFLPINWKRTDEILLRLDDKIEFLKLNWNGETQSFYYLLTD